MVVFVTCKEDPIKNEGAIGITRFSQLQPVRELSVAMETTVRIQSGQNLMKPNPTLIMLKMKFDCDQPAGLRDIYV